MVLGWHSGYYDISQSDLSGFPPVIVVNLSLHRFVMSPAAEQVLQLNYPEIIANYQDPVWFEAHMPQMLTFLSSQVKPTVERYAAFLAYMKQQGVYHVEEIQLPSDNAYRILSAPEFKERTCFWTTPEIYSQLAPETQKGITGIKLFTDGALGARTAALKHPFNDGSNGALLYTDAALYETIHQVAMAQKSIAVHAIGDLSTAQVVRVAGQLQAAGYHFPLFRMEHCQFIEENTARSAKELGITLSMQPNFNSDSTLYKDRLSPYYLENNNPFRLLLDDIGFIAGEDLILGSDGMPHGAEAALNNALFPPYPGQRLSLAEFCAGYGMPDQRFGKIRFQVDYETQSVKNIEVLS